ncbi:hypothetical protein CQR51_0851 [Bifidobacterium pseudolongum subsp. globosum]|uniref:hypothetical protein n=1 Tax=Bifidobacterium pseudolongum TaxID=1694 RepID=UPI000C7075CF|nr:hypothetical protein [Bifidobacterium pseudolongum]PKV06251.1 hypothetical protein CQR51_0851 [Bifidobacterium pseudolongum subsp. globosum]RYQ56459.1 hypothetical protein PG1565B_0920 [Bifidobacterium pseudolongum subsp. globosum]RYQ60787.1 hypothetical protein PG1546B_0920 [Bifidobacterium pseudolongum subsp. globosum]
MQDATNHEAGHFDTLTQALTAMQQMNTESSPYAHAAFDNVLSMLERYGEGEEALWPVLETMLIEVFSFQQFLDMRLTRIEQAQHPPVSW